MRAVLIDDELAVVENLKTLLSIYFPELEIVGVAHGVHEGIACIRKHQPDLVLLDVEMQDGTGFDLLAIYGELDFQLIFVTGHNAFAIKAFKYSALDYVLKPVDPDDLVTAINKAKTITDRTEIGIKVSSLVQNQEVQNQDKKIVLKDADNVYLVALRDIVRCESDANYTQFYLVDGRRLIISKTLKEYDAMFREQLFFRAHQSHLINLMHFDRYEKKEGGTVYMKDGSALPVAVRKKDQLLAALSQL
ncbi:LytR/AlgR family response regulator transcription factor [Reichenbachiella ulvae]|uniref:LytTR family DNA-binding domain-containing protein n=1 Tax=Reichenbachiella ulvae TaxID=2980104 RepID=A0ABT3CU38_9BACT|nr:LytTR family DNA-binding domain-containing protein [Reichenbachiella ulvae]MCV9387112.1 LytTR family DNA-binding domain-containing protein [Reichenbachiella ulvae]